MAPVCGFREGENRYPRHLLPVFRRKAIASAIRLGSCESQRFFRGQVYIANSEARRLRRRLRLTPAAAFLASAAVSVAAGCSLGGGDDNSGASVQQTVVYGTAREFRDHYEPAFGTLADRTDPVIGNHEYHAREDGYYPYWEEKRGWTPDQALHRSYVDRASGWQVKYRPIGDHTLSPFSGATRPFGRHSRV
jgi:hypothetical protein